MPFRKFKRRRTGRQRAARKRRRKLVTRYKRTRLPALGFPKRKLVRLKYCDTINLDPSLSGIAYNYYRCNGMYDPDASLGGHQPLFFDQYMAGYDHFTVIGSKIKVTPCNPTTANIIPVQYGVTIDDDGVFSYSTSDQIIESNQGRYFKLAGAENTPQTRYSNSLVRKWSARKFFGSKSIIGKAEYKGTASGDPLEQAYYGVWVGSVANTDGGNIYLTIELEYIAVLTEPKYVAPS